MYLKNIELTDFRNYKTLSLDFDERVNILVGENGQGKTNLLEAIYLTSIGKSFRTPRDAEMVMFNMPFCRVKAEAFKENEYLEVDMFISREKKGIKVNKVKLDKMSQLLEHIYCVIFSPEDLKTVKEDPEKRRKFINTEICQMKPGYYVNLSQYKKILKQRNIILKDLQGMFKNKGFDEETLEIWDDKLVQYGAAIMWQRKDFIEKLAPISEKIYREITQDKEEFNIYYEPSVSLETSIEDQKKILKEQLNKNKEKDKRYGSTSVGPHKDDMGVFIKGKDARAFGSQGQQRTAALAIKLAEIELIRGETGVKPILLLDDVMSELDGSRQEFLVKALSDVQVFITTAELSQEMRKKLPVGKILNVENGIIL